MREPQFEAVLVALRRVMRATYQHSRELVRIAAMMDAQDIDASPVPDTGVLDRQQLPLACIDM